MCTSFQLSFNTHSPFLLHSHHPPTPEYRVNVINLHCSNVVQKTIGIKLFADYSS